MGFMQAISAMRSRIGSGRDPKKSFGGMMGSSKPSSAGGAKPVMGRGQAQTFGSHWGSGGSGPSMGGAKPKPSVQATSQPVMGRGQPQNFGSRWAR